MKASLVPLAVFAACATLALAQNTPAPQAPAQKSKPASTNAPIEITSAAMTHSNLAGITIFTGNVKAWDDDMELHAEMMIVKFTPSTNRNERQSIASIHADKDVLIINKKDGSKALADKAVYDAKTDIIELTGRTLLDREGILSRQDFVVYDRANSVLQTRGNVSTKIEPELLKRTNSFNRVKLEPAKEVVPQQPKPDKKGNDK